MTRLSSGAASLLDPIDQISNATSIPALRAIIHPEGFFSQLRDGDCICKYRVVAGILG